MLSNATFVHSVWHFGCNKDTKTKQWQSVGQSGRSGFMSTALWQCLLTVNVYLLVDDSTNNKYLEDSRANRRVRPLNWSSSLLYRILHFPLSCDLPTTRAVLPKPQQNNIDAEGVDGADSRKDTKAAARSLKPNTHSCRLLSSKTLRCELLKLDGDTFVVDHLSEFRERAQANSKICSPKYGTRLRISVTKLEPGRKVHSPTTVFYSSMASRRPDFSSTAFNLFLIYALSVSKKKRKEKNKKDDLLLTNTYNPRLVEHWPTDVTV